MMNAFTQNRILVGLFCILSLTLTATQLPLFDYSKNPSETKQAEIAENAYEIKDKTVFKPRGINDFTAVVTIKNTGSSRNRYHLNIDAFDANTNVKKKERVCIIKLGPGKTGECRGADFILDRGFYKFYITEVTVTTDEIHHSLSKNILIKD